MPSVWFSYQLNRYTFHIDSHKVAQGNKHGRPSKIKPENQNKDQTRDFMNVQHIFIIRADRRLRPDESVLVNRCCESCRVTWRQCSMQVNQSWVRWLLTERAVRGLSSRSRLPFNAFLYCTPFPLGEKMTSDSETDVSGSCDIFVIPLRRLDFDVKELLCL